MMPDPNKLTDVFRGMTNFFCIATSRDMTCRATSHVELLIHPPGATESARSGVKTKVLP